MAYLHTYATDKKEQIVLTSADTNAHNSLLTFSRITFRVQNQKLLTECMCFTSQIWLHSDKLKIQVIFLYNKKAVQVNQSWSLDGTEHIAILKHFLQPRYFTLHTASDSHGTQICLYEPTLCCVDLASISNNWWKVF